MKKTWLLESAPESFQDSTITSFMGGKPRIPANSAIPICQLCGAEQTFFFEVAFPPTHSWAGKTLAVFQCTSCMKEDFIIPEMLTTQLKGADIPEFFLDNYQRNFRLLVFNTEDGIVRQSYIERVIFQAWNLVPTRSPGSAKTRVGGNPSWILGNEFPATYNRTTRMCFLMQLAWGFEFPIHSDAPRQIELDLRRNQVPSKNAYYELFIRNAVYFFGTALGMVEPKVYCITQVD